MEYASRLLISDDKAIDNMTDEDITALATFSSDAIPRDVYYLFSDFAPGFENKRKLYFDNNPYLKTKLENKSNEINTKYLSKVYEKENYEEYQDAHVQMSIDFINKYPIFKQYYLKIGYFDEDEKLIHEEYLK